MIRLEKTVLQIVGLESILVRGFARWFLPKRPRKMFLENTMLFPYLSCLDTGRKVLKVCVQPFRSSRTRAFFGKSGLNPQPGTMGGGQEPGAG